MNQSKEFGISFWLHLFAIVFIYASPFVLSWKIIAIFIILYYAQLFIFGNCILTPLQFGPGPREETFYSHYLEKSGIRVNRKKLVYILDYVIPWAILLMALWWQVYVGRRVPL